MKIAALIPVKLSSRRLPNKNFLFLGDKPLLSYIFETVHGIDLIDSVYCYTSRPQILDFVPRGTKLLQDPRI